MNIKTIGFFCAASLLPFVLNGCAKGETTDDISAAKTYFEAWMQTHHPTASATGNGIYLLDEQQGSGAEWNQDQSRYAFVQYTVRNLDGTVSDTNEEEVAKQLLIYNPSYYYGPKVWPIGQNYCYAGIEEALQGMRIGGMRQVVIPFWLLTYSRYSSEEEYLRHASSTSNVIYTLRLYGQTDNIYSWEAEELEQYSQKYMAGADSTYYGGVENAPKYGFYFYSLRKDSAAEIKSDSTFYINYTGRLLNGQVFDTTIEDTAKVYNIYSSSKTYTPVSITKGSSYSTMTMGSSSTSVITGFGAALYMMHPYEKALTAFYSPLGYSTRGSGSLIPGYAPLSFEIELVDQP